MSNIKETEALALAQEILKGTAAESEQGVALKTLQTAMSTSLVGGIQGINSSMVRLNDSLNKLVDKFIEKVDLNADIWDADVLWKYISEIQSKQLQVMDLYRKVVQGKELFPTDTLSEEERKFLKLLNSFDSPAAKKKFLNLVDEMLNKPEENEFNE